MKSFYLTQVETINIISFGQMFCVFTAENKKGIMKTLFINCFSHQFSLGNYFYKITGIVFASQEKITESG